ncbi:MAG: pyridoxal-phosphate dependent enzyme [Acidobacteria bacterium]|nr:pyridoxal-phosphate dependent enzyme [Acidobacteriota bacterium]
MKRLGLERDVVDRASYENAIRRLREGDVVLPTFAELASPERISATVRDHLRAVDPDAPDALNLFRVHWHNDASRRLQAEIPEHIVLPEALTGVRAPIVVMFGNRFPMIEAHKVLAAYGCLAPRLVTGQFDPTAQKAIWPSTGNYCRGGVAISRIMGCRGVAILPEGMSAERFAWLERWVDDPAADIIRTPGSESNVREIYDACASLEREPSTVVFNQFCEFGNYLAHFECTGLALERVTRSLQEHEPGLRPRAFVSATGSAGTLAAGDYLKDRHGTAIVAVEALECPTMMCNGFGEHNIQGIGDKHIPLIHNVMNTDVVTAVSDRATDTLALLFNTAVGREYLVHRRKVARAVVAALPSLGLSSICNVVASIKVAKYFDLGPGEAVLTVATDGAAMYTSELDKALHKHFGGHFDAIGAAEVFGQHLAGASTDHLLELTEVERTRIFNLGYYTWVEQQGVSIDDFQARRHQAFWRSLRELPAIWDRMIGEFNARTGAAVTS